MPSPLPFMKEKPQTGIVTEHRQSPEDDSNPGLSAAASDLLSAIEAKDIKGIAMALQSAFELVDSMPHEEGPNEGEE